MFHSKIFSGREKMGTRAAVFLAAICTAFMLAFVASVSVAPTPAHAASTAKTSCIAPTFAFYPGSTLGRVRYGEVDFHFELCNNVSPTSWNKAVTRDTTNGLGKNLGFYIDSASIVTTKSGSYYAYYRGAIATKSCLPRVGWPCYKSGRQIVEFKAGIWKNQPYVHVTMIRPSDPGITLYRTR